MTYTKKQRKIIHQQLKGAKKYLWDGNGKNNQERYICLAIMQHVLNTSWSWSLAEDVVGERLGVDVNGQPNTVPEWLRDVAGVPRDQLTDLAVQTYRHEWLDHLIEEFSE